MHLSAVEPCHPNGEQIVKFMRSGALPFLFFWLDEEALESLMRSGALHTKWGSKKWACAPEPCHPNWDQIFGLMHDSKNCRSPLVRRGRHSRTGTKRALRSPLGGGARQSGAVCLLEPAIPMMQNREHRRHWATGSSGPSGAKGKCKSETGGEYTGQCLGKVW